MSKNSCLIYEVCYEKSSETRRISHVKARVEKSGTSRPLEEYTKDKIIEMVEYPSFTVKTVIHEYGNTYKDGPPVIVVTLHGTKYIKTEKNDKTEDNLGEMPTYERK